MSERPAHFSVYRLTLTPLTPIHIGTGESLEPTQYDVKPPTSPNGAHVLEVVDTDTLLSRLTAAQRQEFIKITETANLATLRNWFRGHPERAKYLQFKLPLTSLAGKNLHDNLDNRDQQGEIDLMPRDPRSGCCYIPGSSVKGAIRTAVIDAIARQSPQKQPELLQIVDSAERDRWASARFEAVAMGNMQKGSPDLYGDPFRQVAISDLLAPPNATYVDRIRILKRSHTIASDPSGILMYRELTRSRVLEESLPIIGELRLLHGLKQQRMVPQELSVSALVENCNCFYIPRLKAELKTFNPAAVVQQRLEQILGGLTSQQCVIRVGRHSHFECVTLGEPYHLAPRKGYGATRSYAAGKPDGPPALPLGWAMLSFEATI